MSILTTNLTPIWTGSEFTNSTADTNYKSRWSGIYEDYIIIGGNNITLDIDSGITAGAAFIYNKVGLDWYQQAKLTQDNPVENSYYGESVAINNQYAIVGSPGEVNGSDTGVIYVYSKNGTNWDIHAKLTGSSGSDNGFGDNVAINETNNTLIVSAIADGSSGKFFIYTLAGTSWSQQASITDFAGSPCSICEETILLGAPDVGTGGTAKVYTRSESSWSLQTTLTKTSPVSGDKYGSSVSLSGEYIAIGVPGDDRTGYTNSGSIYIYKKTETTWEEQAKLTALMTEQYISGSFGTSVSLKGHMLIGTSSGGTLTIYKRDGISWDIVDTIYNNSSSTGKYWTEAALYHEHLLVCDYLLGQHSIYHINTLYYPASLKEVVKLTASDKDEIEDENYGETVAIDGNYAIVSAYQQMNRGYSNVGAVYVYYNDSNNRWIEQAKITVDDLFVPETAEYGMKLDISGDYFVVSARLDDIGYDNTGTIYVYKKDTLTGTWGNWIEHAKLTASDADDGDNLGFALSIDGKYIVGGAVYAEQDNGYNNNGFAYVFERKDDSWTEIAKLTPTTQNDFGYFGHMAKISDDYIIIGKAGDDLNEPYTQLGENLPVTGTQWGKFDTSSALSYDGEYIAIGNVYADGGGTDKGEVYVFRYSGGSWSQIGDTLVGAANNDQFGQSVSLSYDGLTLAVGSPYNIGSGASDNNQGQVQVYTYSGDSWSQKGSDIESSIDSSLLGWDVKLSDDGDILAASAYTSDYGLNDAGHVIIYNWSGSAWVQLGDRIEGEKASDNSGISIDLSSDGLIIAIGADLADSSVSNTGHVRIFVWDGSAWVQRGDDIDGATSSDRFGHSVSLSSDGTIIAIGAYDGPSNAGNANGSVQVYKWSGTSWDERGSILSYSVTAVADFGKSVSLSDDGNVLVIGVPGDDSYATDAGIIYIYKWIGDWTLYMDGITGSITNEDLGYHTSISGDGKRIVLAPGYTGVLSNPNGIVSVRVYEDSITDKAGSALIFKKELTNFTSIVKLTPDETISANDRFGNPVAIDGNYAIIGSYLYDTSGYIDTGTVYIAKYENSSWSIIQKIVSTLSNLDNTEFGCSLGLSGDYAVIGERNGDIVDYNENSYTDAGVINVYKRDDTTWINQARLTASDASDNDTFGYSVAIDGEYIVAGAIYADLVYNNEGLGYIFKRNGTSWTEEAKLTISTSTEADYLGASCAISGNYAVIGMIGSDNKYDNDGSVYVFLRDGSDWTEQAKLTASEAHIDENFGLNVSIDNSTKTLVVGCELSENSGYPSNTSIGNVYVFVRNGTNWSEQAILTASDGNTNDLFGSSVVVKENIIIVGAKGYGEPQYNSAEDGAIYVYSRINTAWTEIKKITGISDENFGISIDLDINEKNIIIGANTNSEYESNSGASYIYSYDIGWEEIAKLTETTPVNNNYFGQQVAIDSSSNTAIVGENSNGTNHFGYIDAGAIYVFTKSTITEIEHKLTNPTLSSYAASDFYGWSVAIDGDYAIVGAQMYNNPLNYYHSYGAAFIYHFSNDRWYVQKTIYGNSSSGRFGYLVRISNNIIGVLGDISTSFYIYTRDGTTWTEQAKLTYLTYNLAGADINGDTSILTYRASLSKLIVYVKNGTNWDVQETISTGSNYGFNAKISGDNIVVSSALDIKVYNRSVSTWSLVQTLSDYDGQIIFSPGSVHYNFVSINNNYFALVSAGYNVLVAKTAYVYFYENNTWYLQAKLTTGDTNSLWSTGHDSIAINDSYLIWGMGKADSVDDFRSVAYIFKRFGTQWKYLRKITPSETLDSSDITPSMFGMQVDISSNQAIIGAPDSTIDSDTYIGQSYIYDLEANKESWSEQAKLTASDMAEGDALASVAIQGDVIVGGAPYANAPDNDYESGGSAYIFRRKDSAWSEYGKLTASSFGNNAFGISVDIGDHNIIVGESTNIIYDNPSVYIFQDIAICYHPDTMIMTDQGYVKITKLQRGDMIKTLTGFEPLARLIQRPPDKKNDEYIVFEKDSIDTNIPNNKLIITKGHPVYYNDDYFNPEDFVYHPKFTRVHFEEMTVSSLFHLQFETHQVIYSNNFTTTSFPPTTTYGDGYLKRELYFDKSKFNVENIGKMYPPYCLHDVPLPNNKLFALL